RGPQWSGRCRLRAECSCLHLPAPWALLPLLEFLSALAIPCCQHGKKAGHVLYHLPRLFVRTLVSCPLGPEPHGLGLNSHGCFDRTSRLHRADALTVRCAYKANADSLGSAWPSIHCRDGSSMAGQRSAIAHCKAWAMRSCSSGVGVTRSRSSKLIRVWG